MRFYRTCDPTTGAPASSSPPSICLTTRPPLSTQIWSAARTVLDYLRRPDLVSGVPADVRPAMHAHFAEVLRRRCPEVLADEGGDGDDADEPRGRAAQRVELGGGAFSFGFA